MNGATTSRRNMDRNGVRMATRDTEYGQGKVYIGNIRNVYGVLLNIGNPTPARTLQWRHPVLCTPYDPSIVIVIPDVWEYVSLAYQRRVMDSLCNTMRYTIAP